MYKYTVLITYVSLKMEQIFFKKWKTEKIFYFEIDGEKKKCMVGERECSLFFCR